MRDVTSRMHEALSNDVGAGLLAFEAEREDRHFLEGLFDDKSQQAIAQSNNQHLHGAQKNGQ